MVDLKASYEYMKECERKFAEAVVAHQKNLDATAVEKILSSDKGYGFAVANYFGLGSIESVTRVKQPDAEEYNDDFSEIFSDDYVDNYGMVELFLPDSEESIITSAKNVRVITDRDGGLMSPISEPLCK